MLGRSMTIAALALLAGCAGPEANDYAGEPIEKVARQLGYPSQIIELPDGRRTYSWDITSTTQTGPIRPVLRGINVGLSSDGDSGVGVGIGLERENTVTTTCTYTLTATRSGDTFVVEDGPVGNPACLS